MLKKAENLNKVYLDYLGRLISDSDPQREAKLAWRISCLEMGRSYVEILRSKGVKLEDSLVFDAAGAWGGHALAFAEAGAKVLLADLNDHCYKELGGFVEELSAPIDPILGDCQCMPLGDSSVDIVLGFELLEHIPSAELFASEIGRVLKPGGVALVSTPARLRSVFGKEPHYQLRGLAVLPFGIQGFVARSVFGRDYPFPITRQYSFASSVLKPFRDNGMQGEAIISERLNSLSSGLPILKTLVPELMWNYFLLRKLN